MPTRGPPARKAMHSVTKQSFMCKTVTFATDAVEPHHRQSKCASRRRRQYEVGALPPPIIRACHAASDPRVVGARVLIGMQCPLTQGSQLVDCERLQSSSWNRTEQNRTVGGCQSTEGINQWKSIVSCTQLTLTLTLTLYSTFHQLTREGKMPWYVLAVRPWICIISEKQWRAHTLQWDSVPTDACTACTQWPMGSGHVDTWETPPDRPRSSL